MVTIIKNKYGHLCIWKGEKHIFAKGANSFIDYQGNECELYFDYQDDINLIMSIFNKQELSKLEEGKYIHTEKFNENNLK